MVSKNKHVGSSFDDFLEEEDLLVTTEVEAIKPTFRTPPV